METGLPESAIRHWVAETFITEHGTRGTAYRGVTLTADMPNAVADALVDRHILTTEQRASATWYQLGQDLLVTAVRQADRDHAMPAAGSPGDYRSAAEAAFGQGNFDSARRFAQTAAEQYRTRGDDLRAAHAMALGGTIARMEGDLVLARDSFNAARSEFEIVEDQRSAARMLAELGRVSLDLGDLEEAADLLARASERLPGDAGLRAELGYALLARRAPVDAVAVFNQSIRLDPELATAYAGRAAARHALGEAADDLSRASALGLTTADRDRLGGFGLDVSGS